MNPATPPTGTMRVRKPHVACGQVASPGRPRPACGAHRPGDSGGAVSGRCDGDRRTQLSRPRGCRRRRRVQLASVLRGPGFSGSDPGRGQPGHRVQLGVDSTGVGQDHADLRLRSRRVGVERSQPGAARHAAERGGPTCAPRGPRRGSALCAGGPFPRRPLHPDFRGHLQRRDRRGRLHRGNPPRRAACAGSPRHHAQCPRRGYDQCGARGQPARSAQVDELSAYRPGPARPAEHASCRRTSPRQNGPSLSSGSTTCSPRCWPRCVRCMAPAASATSRLRSCWEARATEA